MDSIYMTLRSNMLILKQLPLETIKTKNVSSVMFLLFLRLVKKVKS